MLAAEQRLRRASGGKHDVGAIDGLIKLLKRNCLPAKGFRHLNSALVSSVGKENVAGASGNQMPRCQFSHLARAYHIHCPVSERAEYLLR